MCVEVALTKALFLLWFYEGAYGSSVLTAFWDLLAQRALPLDFFRATSRNEKIQGFHFVGPLTLASDNI